MRGAPWSLVAAAVAVGAACSSPETLEAQGGPCFLATDCQEGLVCIPQPDGSRRCSSDLSSIQVPAEAGASDAVAPVPEARAPADTAAPDAGAGPDTNTPQPDVAAPPDVGSPPDTGMPDVGSPPDTGAPDVGLPPDTGAGSSPDTGAGSPPDTGAPADATGSSEAATD